jgi:hypothetical protein
VFERDVEQVERNGDAADKRRIKHADELHGISCWVAVVFHSIAFGLMLLVMQYDLTAMLSATDI